MTPSDTPLGINQLKPLDRVLIREKTAVFNNNKYVVMAPDGAVILYAKEDSGIVNRVLVGKSRAFEIDIFDTQDREVIKLRRPYTVGPDKMDITMCGQPAAIVRKEVTFFKPVLNINDAADRPFIRVKGPVSTSGECDYELYSTEKKRIGAICKRWTGISRTSRDSDSFVIHFPVDLDVRYKAAIIGTCFLIDFLIYDN
ncbi:phospholipid scramblase 1-like [Epargyreus clarus]|uniref:phospholipid scramblase 1-like n=1 Tax=Epargyreus clarus TaxID=520877 RepID=UPI003C2E32A5